MSDEEKKTELKSLIEDYEICFKESKYEGNIEEYKSLKETYKLLKDILNLIEKQQKEIEDLENGDLTTVYMSGFYDGEKKWKDKIKAKKEYYKSYENREIYEYFNYGEIVQVLDELYKEKEGNQND